MKIISKQTTPFKIWNKLEIFGNIDTRYRMDKNNFYIISSSSINFKESALKVIINLLLIINKYFFQTNLVLKIIAIKEK